MAVQTSTSAFKYAEQRCEKARLCLERAAIRDDHAYLIQEALQIYQEVLEMDLEIEEPYLGLAYLTLCAENYPITERLLCSAERINPASTQVLHLRQQLKHHAQNRFSSLDLDVSKTNVIESIQRLQTPQKISTGKMPRALQRIFGPIEGLFKTTQELQENMAIVFEKKLTDDQAQKLLQFLSASEPIDLATTLKEVQLLLSEISPRFQRKLSLFAEEISQHPEIQIKFLSAALKPLKERFAEVNELKAYIDSQSDNLIEEALTQKLLQFMHRETPTHNCVQTILNTWSKTNIAKAYQLQSFCLWAQEFWPD